MVKTVSFDEVFEELTNGESGDAYRVSDSLANIVASIIKARVEKGMTQRQLAEKCGIKQSAIARIETLQVIPRLDTILKIADGVGMTLVPQITSVAVPKLIVYETKEQPIKTRYSSYVAINTNLYGRNCIGTCVG